MSASVEVPVVEFPTDSTLTGIAMQQFHEAPRGTELAYFLDEDSDERTPLVAALRAAWFDGCLSAASALARDPEEQS